MDKSEIEHPSHMHKLVLEVPEQDEGKQIVCYGCGDSAIGKPTYRCIQCNIFLHKSCAELEEKIQHPEHNHPLTLFYDRCFKCKLCIKDFEGFSYSCPGCDFDVDVSCSKWPVNNQLLSQSENRYSTPFKHRGHPHPLKPLARSASFRCNACFHLEEDLSYHCMDCFFWIHKSCAELEDPLIRQALHEHPLSLDYDVQDKYYGQPCDYCRNSLYSSGWIYYCSNDASTCPYFIHLKCAKDRMESTKNEFKDSSEDEAIPKDTVRLPVDGVSFVLVKNYLKVLTQPSNDPLTHPSHDPLTQPTNDPLTQPSNGPLTHPSHGHPLTLTNKEDDYSKMFKDDQDTVCNACVEHISGWYYACVNCNFYLHVHCTQLPKEISHHHIHEHKLSLTFGRELFSLRCCDICDRHSNGFFYECKKCFFSYDIKCALLPREVKHNAHKHLLVQDKAKSSRDYCNACRKSIYGSFKLGCENCKLSFHIECIMLPKTVRHRWDKHPLTLSFPPFVYQTICEICEDEIHPNCWLYHCDKCDNSFHTKCLPRIAEKYNVKLGVTLEKDYHPHPLTFVRRAKYNSYCQICHRDLRNLLVLECQRCMLSFCHLCDGQRIHNTSLEQPHTDNTFLRRSYRFLRRRIHGFLEALT